MGREVPRVIRQQRWSPLNVPLLWSGAGVEETSPVLDWLASVAGTMHQDVEFHEGVSILSMRFELVLQL